MPVAAMLQIEDYSPSLTYLDSNVTKLAMCAIVLWWGAGLASGEELKIRITLSERAIKSIQSGLKDATLGISWEDQVQGVGVSVDELKVDSNRKAKILIKVPKPGRYTLYGAIGNSLSGSTELPLGVLRVNGKKAGDWSFREYQHEQAAFDIDNLPAELDKVGAGWIGLKFTYGAAEEKMHASIGIPRNGLPLDLVILPIGGKTSGCLFVLLG